MDHPPVVLLVHPHVDTREMCAEYLRHIGWSVLEAAGGGGALHAVPNADVIVTGLCLDGPVDGTTLIAQIRQDRRLSHVPTIVMTANVLPGDRQRAEAAGCDAFLPLPCLPDALAREIRRLLAVPPVPKPRRSEATRPRADLSGA